MKSGVSSEVVGGGRVFLVTLYRPLVKNAVDGVTAKELYDVFKRFDADSSLRVAVLFGEGGTFCAGADLTQLSNPITPMGDLGPMGPTRLVLSKPVVAAVEGYAVAGGLELALWCDLRVATRESVFGVFCRRVGVPLIDGGTFRLAQCVGTSRAMDAILTGRAIPAEEAFQWGLVNRLVEKGQAKKEAIVLAEQIAAHPQLCMQSDRLSVYQSSGLQNDAALRSEFHINKIVLAQASFAQGVQATFKGSQLARERSKL